MVPASAVCVALVAAACGGSVKHTPTTATTAFHGSILAGTTAVRTRATLPAPTPAQIERGATLTAARSGFTAKISATLNLPQLNGNAVSAVGNGFFDPRSSSGTLDLVVGLPGLLGLAGPLPTQVRLVGGEAYVQVPSDLAGALGTRDAWLDESISVLGLGDSLNPPDILRELARDAIQTVPGQRARVTLDPITGLVRTIVLSYAAAGGYHVHVRVSLTGFGIQPATTAPPPARIGELQAALKDLGF